LPVTVEVAGPGHMPAGTDLIVDGGNADEAATGLSVPFGEGAIVVAPQYVAPPVTVEVVVRTLLKTNLDAASLDCSNHQPPRSEIIDRHGTTVEGDRRSTKSDARVLNIDVS